MPVGPTHDPPGELPSVPFVGRHAELAGLERMLEHAQAGRPGLVLVEGPAGIGKTALVQRFLDRAGELCVLHASGEEAETTLAYGVFDQLTVHASTPPLAAASRDGDRAIDPLTAGAVLVGLLGELQHPGPVVLVVDDAHWADRPSLLALTFTLRRLRADRVLALVLTREVADPRLPEGLRRLLTGDHTLRLILRGLTSGELRTLSAEFAPGPLSAQAAARLRAHTDGNPLHARALLEQLPAAAFSDWLTPLPAPRSFALLVVGRLAACPAHTQELTAAASVLGVRFPLHLAAMLANLDDPLPALDQAIAAGLLVEEPGTQMVRFGHPLIHAAIYQQLGPARRSALHTRIAGLAADESTRLRHRTLAASGPDPTLAGDLAAFGRRQVTAGAWGSAIEPLAAAARLTASRVDHEELTLEAVECQLLLGDLPDATVLTTKLRAFQETGWRSYVLGRLAFVVGRLDQAGALLGDAWQRCDPDTEPALAARIAGQQATLCVLRARGQEAADWADVALRLAPEQTATDMLRFLRVVGLGISAHAEAALTVLGNLPDPAVASTFELDTLLGRGLLRIWTDDLIHACRDLGGVLAASHGRSVAFRMAAADLLSVAEYRLGQWDDAVIHSDLAVSLATDADQPVQAPFCHATSTLILAARGEWEQAAMHADTARLVAVTSGNLLASGYAAAAAAQLARAGGQPEGVIAALDPLLHLETRDGIDEPAMIGWQDLLVDALVAVGDLNHAQEVLGSFEARAAGRQRHSAMAAAARARGNLLAARGDTAAAAGAFQTGLDLVAHVDMPFDRAMLELAYGLFLRRAGKRTAAATQLQAAKAVFQRLGARPYLERCERELAASGHAPAPRSPPDHASLTPQELAVARLVAQGLANRQVARELVISTKTVEYHLGHVYAKLQVRSRVQLARRLTTD